MGIQIHFRFKGLACFMLALVFEFPLFQGYAFAATVPTSAAFQSQVPQVTVTPTVVQSPCFYTATDTYVGPNLTSNSQIGYGGSDTIGYGPGPYSTENIGSGGNAMGGGYISMPSPPMTDISGNLVLGFRGGAWSNPSSNWATASWNSSAASPLSNPIATGCGGTYQVFFTVQLQATYYNTGNAGNPPPPAPPSINVNLCVQTTDATTSIWGGGTFSNGACPVTPANQFVFKPVCNGGNYCSVQTFYFSTQVRLAPGQTVAAPVLHTSAPVNVTGGEFTVVYIGP